VMRRGYFEMWRATPRRRGCSLATITYNADILCDRPFGRCVIGVIGLAVKIDDNIRITDEDYSR